MELSSTKSKTLLQNYMLLLKSETAVTAWHREA